MPTPVLHDGNFDLPFSMTPILEDSTQLLMIACISMREFSDNRLVSSEKSGPVKFHVSSGVSSKPYVMADGLDQLTIQLSSVDCAKPTYDLWVSVGETMIELIPLPYKLAGCRASYFPISSLNCTVCLVHQLLSGVSDLDMFVEEQEFMFSVLEIQDTLFLRDGEVPAPIHYVESSVVYQDNEHRDEDETHCDFFSTELQMMASIMKKYSN